jgi:tripartite-type tricarboxylate transporter receptor subunit TctC
MQLSLGQPLIIENVTGASGSIAVGRVAHATPDGYTLCFGNWSTHVINGAALALPYDVLDDFAPVAMISDSPMVLVTKDIPANNLQEFVGWLKANPGKGSQGTPGVAGAAHLAGVLFQNITGTRFQFVPYRGVGPAMQDLLGGRIDFMFDLVANSLAQIQSGKLKALAVLSKTRLSLLPNVPNVDEAGVPGLYVSSWQAIWAPKATPDTIIARLNRAAMGALDEPTTRQRLIGLAQTIPERDQQTTEALGALHRAEIKKWWPIIKAAGIKAE